MLTQQEFQTLVQNFGIPSDNQSYRMDGIAIAMLTVLRSLSRALTEPKMVWDTGFGTAALNAYTIDPSNAVDRSQYTAAQWLRWRLLFNVFGVATNVPITTLASLAVVDAEGNVVPGADNQPIRPFNVIPPGVDLGNDLNGTPFVSYTMFQIAHSAVDRAEVLGPSAP